MGASTDRRKLIGAAVAVAGVATVSKKDRALAESPDEFQSDIVGKQNDIFFHNQPPPIYDFSAPRDIVRQLYDAIVPKLVNTWTVFSIPGVGPIDVTPSKGFPIPYGSQLTSPEYMKTDGNGGDSATSVTLPQPEPDGLYRSGETDATWVLAVNDDGYVIPEYHEEIVTCYPFPVSIDPQTRMIVRNAKSSTVVIDTAKMGG